MRFFWYVNNRHLRSASLAFTIFFAGIQVRLAAFLSRTHSSQVSMEGREAMRSNSPRRYSSIIKAGVVI